MGVTLCEGLCDKTDACGSSACRVKTTNTSYVNLLGAQGLLVRFDQAAPQLFEAGCDVSLAVLHSGMYGPPRTLASSELSLADAQPSTSPHLAGVLAELERFKVGSGGSSQGESKARTCAICHRGPHCACAVMACSLVATPASHEWHE